MFQLNVDRSNEGRKDSSQKRNCFFVTEKIDRLALSVDTSLTACLLLGPRLPYPFFMKIFLALCKENAALHSVPPHNLLIHSFCVQKIIL